MVNGVYIYLYFRILRFIKLKEEPKVRITNLALNGLLTTILYLFILFFVLFRVDMQFLNPIRKDSGRSAQYSGGFGHIAARIFQGFNENFPFVGLHQGLK